MAKLSLARLLATGAAIAQGTIQGQIQGDQEKRAREQQDLNTAMDVAHVQAQQQQYQQSLEERRHAELGNLLNSPFLDDSSGQGVLDEYLKGTHAQPQPDPYGAVFSSPAMQNLLRRRGITLPGQAPGTPQPGGSPAGQAPTAAPLPATPPPAAPAILPQGGLPGAAPTAGTYTDFAPGTSPTPGQVAPPNPAMAAAAGTPAGTAAAPPADGRPRFKSKRERDVEALVGQRLARVQGAADQSGDPESAQQALQLQTQLVRGEITPDHALSKLEQIETQSRTSNSTNQSFSHTLDRWGRYRAEGQISDPYIAQVNPILGEMEALGALDTPDKRKRASALMQQLGQIAAKPDVLRPDYRAQFQQDQADFAHYGVVKTQIENTLDALRRAKGMPPEWVASQIEALQTYLQNPAVQKMGYKLPVDFRPTGKGKAELPDDKGGYAEGEYDETPEVAMARNLAAAAKYTEDPQQKQKILTAGYQKLMGFVQSDQFRRINDPKQRAGVLHSLNTVAEEMGLPGLPDDLTAGLDPKEKAYATHLSETRKLQQQRIDTQKQALSDLNEHRAFMRQFMLRQQRFHERDVNADNQRADAAAGKGKEKAQTQAQVQQLHTLNEDYEGVMKQLDKATGIYGPYGPLMTKDNPQQAAERDQVLKPLIDRAATLRQQMQAIIGTLPGADKLPSQKKGQGQTWQFSYGGQDLSLSNPYPDLKVPTPGQKITHDYPGHFGRFNRRVLEIARGVTGNPTAEAEFIRRFDDPAAGRLYLWEARYKAGLMPK